MDNQQVIKMRDMLKSGKNFPLRMTVCDHLTTIDESKIFQFTKWDDANFTLYSFRLVNPDSDTIPSNIGNAISVMGIPYSNITSMEIAQLPTAEIETVFESLSSYGCSLSSEFKNLIKHTFTSVLHPDRYQLPPTVITELLGGNAVNDKDDYYAGRYVESAKETLRYLERNKEIADSDNG